jgi:pyruvate/2-oxoglutarate dehydrogenase complex dihydrolipoamide acyltransferase (E2) component
MTDIVFPAMSKENADAEGVVATWFVSDGESVAEGQLVAEVAMDKVDMEVTAPASGVISLGVAEGAAIRQGGVIATIS